MKRLGYEIRDLTMGHVMSDKAATIGDKVYLTFLPDGRQFTYRDIHLVSNRYANGLIALGIGPGTHVAVMMETCPEHWLLYAALNKIGAVAVPINIAARGMLLKYFLNQFDAEVMICDERLLERFLEIGAEVSKVRQVVVLPEGASLRMQAMPRGIPLANFRTLEGHAETMPGPGPRFCDLAFIAHTSGTTGPSKGVIYTHARALLGGIGAAEAHGHNPNDIIYVCAPLFHNLGLQGSTYPALFAEASVAMTRRFSVSSFWNDVRATQATIVNILGSMTNMLWNQPPTPQDADNKVHSCCTVPIPPFGPEFEKRFGLRLLGAYGLTDFGTVATYTLIDPASKRGSAGRPRRDWDIRIFDEDDMELPQGQVGEIVLRSKTTWASSLGYYNMPEATVAAMRNGWFHTGDRGYLDEDGFLYFAGRIKDAIRRRGENISAFEVEQVIQSHPAVADAAVYPLSSEMSEDEVTVSVTVNSGMKLEESELIEFCARNLAYFMVPRFVHFTSDLPRTMTGKVEKYKLRDAAERDRSLLWDRERAGIVLSR